MRKSSCRRGRASGPVSLVEPRFDLGCMSFVMLHVSSAAEATSTISSLKSTFVTIAFGPASLVSLGVLGERARVRACGRVDLVHDCFSRLVQVCERELRMGRGVAVVPAVWDRHRSTRHRTMELSGCGASAVSRRKSETVLYAEEQHQ